MATAVDRRQMELDDIAPAAAPAKKRRGWVKRMMLCSALPLVADKSAAAASTAAADDDGATRRPRRGGWHALGRRRWKQLRGGSWSRLPSWKRISAGGGWASALLDAAAFRVMYVVEAVVLGLVLSCFFCCCGCQI